MLLEMNTALRRRVATTIHLSRNSCGGFRSPIWHCGSTPALRTIVDNVNESWHLILGRCGCSLVGGDPDAHRGSREGPPPAVSATGTRWAPPTPHVGAGRAHSPVERPLEGVLIAMPVSQDPTPPEHIASGAKSKRSRDGPNDRLPPVAGDPGPARLRDHTPRRL